MLDRRRKRASRREQRLLVGRLGAGAVLVLVTFILVAGFETRVERTAATGRLAFVHGNDLETSPAGAGAFAWLSNGDGTFTACRVGTAGFDRNAVGTEAFGADGASQTFFADVNADGVADVVHVSENDSRSIRVYLAQGDGTFAKAAIATTGIVNTGVGSSVFAGDSASETGFLRDVTGDAVPDYLLTTELTAAGAYVWAGNGDGTFAAGAPTATTGFTGLVTTTIFTGNAATERTFLRDVTGDGIDDIVHASESDGRSVTVWSGNGDGTFQTSPVKTTGFNNAGVGTGAFVGVSDLENTFLEDVTTDTRADLVFVNDTGIFVWPGNGDGTFATAAPTATTGFTKSFASFAGSGVTEDGQLVDVTSDGRPDYVMTKDDQAQDSGIYVWPGNAGGTFATTPVVTRASGGLASFGTGRAATDTSAVVPAIAADATLLAGGCTEAAPGGVAANLLVWNKADSGISVANGQTVDTWPNRADGGYNVAQATAAARPTYFSTTPGNLVNFNPALRFDGGDELQKTDILRHHNTSGFHGVVVARDERTNLAELRGPMGLGSNGNFPGFDLQTDATSARGWNPWMGSGSTPNEWPSPGAVLFNGNTGGDNRQPQIFGLGSANGGASTNANNIASMVDGLEEATTLDAVNNSPIGAGVWLGSSGDSEWIGLVGEAIVYSRRLDATELRRVTTYLALKYGITISQTSPRNYLASDGTVVWNASTNSNFARDIAGIGRDNLSGLEQKQSASVNAGNILTIGLGAIEATNAANSNTFPADRSFLVWGHNGGSLAQTAQVGATGLRRLNRIWLVEETGTVGDVRVRIPVTAIQGNAPVLVRSGDATFDGSDEQIAMSRVGASYEATVDFADGDRFTFASATIAPGGVTGASLWLRADRHVATSGSTAVSWTDVAVDAVFDRHASEALPPYRATSVAFNFNPSLDFSVAGSQLRGVAGDIVPETSYDEFSIFGAVTKEANGQRFFAARNADSNHFVLDSSQGGRAAAQINYVTGGTVPNGPQLVGVSYNGTDANRRGYLNGRVTVGAAAANASTTFTFPGEAEVGAGYGVNDWTGDVAEVVAYPRQLLPAEAQRLNSYLALKYGRTLDQTTATNYFASNAAVVWNATTNSGFDDDIAGIGRDDLSGLDQKQSASVNAGNIVTVGLGTIAATNQLNDNAFPTDRSFLVWGHDAGSTEVSTPISGLPTVKRMTRLWKVQETGSVGTVRVSIPAASLPAAALSSEPPQLAVSEDATITSADTFVPLTRVGANYEGDVDLANGWHFTFAATVAAPGGVTQGMQLWLRADKGLAVNASSNATRWEDQSQYDRDASLVVSDPQRIAGAVNFNPTVRFDGNDHFRFGSSPFVSSFTAGEVFALPRNGTSGCACGHVFDFGSGSRASHYTWSNNNVYEGFGTTDRLGWHPETLATADAKTGATVGGAAVDTHVPHVYNVGSAAASWHVAFDGTNVASSGTNTASFGLAAGNEHVGAVSGYVFNGDIAEVTLYNRRLVGGERQRVNSYYALKYGITLPSTVNYFDSGGAVVWPLSSGFGNDVAGIGRDDGSALDQRQSASINATNIVTIGHGAVAADNASNPNGFTTDRSFLVWGHNGGSKEQTVAIAGTTPALTRMSRLWRVEETGTVGTAVVRIPRSVLRGRPSPVLIRSLDATITSTDEILPLMAVGSNYEVSIDLADGDHVTFASVLPAPGGVTAGLHMWYRADGFSPTTPARVMTDADDETGNYALGWTVNGTPEIVPGGINFNPYLNFQGEWLVRNDSQSSTFTAGEKFAVGRHAPTFTGNNGVLFRFGESTAASTPGASHYLHSNGNYYNDFCTSERKAWNPSTLAVVEGGGTTSGPAVNAKTFHILGMRSQTNSWVHQFDGVNAYTDTASGFNCAGTLMYLGAHENFPYHGDLAEGFVYNRVLTATERVRVNTYLALKYGVTLGSTTTPVSYRASDDAIVWTGSATHQNDVAGIGRDDFGGLDQRQSTSINTGSIVTIGHGAIAADTQSNPNAFASDKSFLVWGHDAGATTTSTPVPGTAPALNRMARIWKADETGSTGTVVVRVPASALAGTAPVVIQSADASFDSTDPRTPMTQVGAVYQASVDLGDEFITFAAEPVGPGGVTSGLQLWLRADEGVEVNDAGNATLWADRSISGRSANLVTGDPAPVADAANFNPVMRLDGDDYFRFGSSPFVTGYTAGEVFTMLKNNRASTANNGHAFDFGSSSRQSAYTWPLNGGSIYDGFGTTQRLGWNPTNRSVAEAKPGVSAVTGPTFDTHDYHVYNTRSKTGEWGVRIDGTSTATTSTNTTSFTLEATNEAIGLNGSTLVFGGDIGDVALYNRVLTASEVARVQSYLAVKYGITLDQTSGGQSYVSARDVVVWDKDADPDGAGPLAAGAYNDDIAGIARDTPTSLFQPKSRSINTDAIVTMGAATQLDDGDFLVWGNDGAAAAAWGTAGTGGAPAHYRRIQRTWSVQKTAEPGPVTVAVDVADPQLDLPAPMFDFFLLRDADGDNVFTDETPVRLYDDGSHGDETAGDNRFSAEGVTFADDEEFTVATFNGFTISGRVLDAAGGAGLNGKKVSLLLDGGAKVTVTTATNAAGGGQTGEFLFSGVDMRTTSIVAVFLDDEVENAVTVTRDADDSITGLDLIVGALTVRHEDGGPLTNDDIFVAGGFGGTPDADVTAVATVDASPGGTLTTAAGVDLRVHGGSTFTPGANVVVGDDLSIGTGATLTAASSIALAGDWVNAGTFVAGTGTVTLDGGDQAIVGATTFHSLVKTEAINNGASSTLTLDDAGITVTGTLTLDGLDADDRLLVRSDAPGSAATITLSGADAALGVGDFLDVRDSALAVDGTAAVAFPAAPAQSFDSGNTTNWFGNLLVEFATVAAEDAEATGGNLPALLVRGHGTSSAKTIDVVLTGGTTTAGSDFDFVSPSTVTIPAGDYNAAQTIASPSLTVLDDGVLEGPETILLGLADTGGGAASGDADEADGVEEEHTYTILDDETASVAFDLAGSTTTDEVVGPAVNLRLSLVATTGVPTVGPGVTVQGDVSYGAASTATNGADIAFDPVTIAFIEGSGNGAVAPVAYSLVDDALIEGNETAVLAVAANSGGTVTPTVGATDTHTLTITDDDAPGVSILQTDGSTSVGENGVVDELRVRLTATPAANVTVTFATDLGQVAAPAALSFTPSDWDVFQTVSVTAVDDFVIEGVHADDVDFSTTSSDPGFEGLTGDDAVTVSVADDDVAGVVVTVVDDLTSEAGDTGSFRLRLTAQPSAPVTIALSSSNTGEATVPASITIDPANWDNPAANVVTVTGVDDDPPVGDGAVPVTIVTGDVTSTDTAFDALDGADVEDVTVYNQNNDPPGFAVEVVDPSSSEDGSAAAVRFRLLSQPTAGASVTIPLSLSDASEASGPASVTIAAADWDDPAANQVLLTGIDDSLDDGDVPYQLLTGDPTSADPAYDALGASDVADPALTNLDDEEPAVLVTESDGSTSVAEGGSGDTISVALASQPAPGKQVVVRLVPHPQVDVGAGPGVPRELVFTEANWSSGIPVTIVATDDTRLEGNHSAAISFVIDAATTTEDGYDGVTRPPLAVSIVDDDTATASIAAAANAAENPAAAGSFTVSLSRQNDTGGPVTVSYSLAGTATAAADYTAPSGSVAIPNGQSSATVAVDTTGLDDALLEGPESVAATLTGTSHALVTVDPGADEATITIADDEQASASLSLDSDGAEAGSANVVFRVTLSRPNDTGAPITFAIDPSGGTAIAGADYGGFAGSTVSVPAGASSATFGVQVLDDTLLEVAETVRATISSPSLGAVSIAGAEATGSIADDEAATVSLSVDADGGEAGPTSIVLRVTLSRQNDTGAPISVSLDPIGGSALADADYAGFAGATVTVPAGASSATRAVAVTNDALLERTETVTAEISSPSSAAVTLADATATASIADDEQADVSVTASDAGASESPADGGAFSIHLSRPNDTGSPLALTYAVGGTGTGGADYATLSGSVEIPDGASMASVAVDTATFDDALFEGTETVVLTLTGADHPAVGVDGSAAEATVAIADDEAATVSVVASDPGAAENPPDPGSFTVQLSRENDTGAPIAVAYSVAGTATAESDYGALAGTVEIAAGADSALIDVLTETFDDALLEGAESVVVTLTGTSHSAVGVDPGGDEATVTIADDDQASATLAVETGGSETGPVDLAFRVTLSAPNDTGAPITFAIDPSGGTATAGADYADFAGSTVAVPPGGTSATFAIDVLDDGLLEAAETLRATISAPSHEGVTIAGADATGSIADDDAAAVSLAATDAEAAENPADNGVFTVSLSKQNDTGAPIGVSYAVAGTATGGADYGALSGSVEIPAGASSATVTVAPATFDDALLEGAETVVLTLTATSNPAVGVDGGSDEATVTIADDDGATVSVAATDAGAAENPADDGVFTISLSKQNDTGAPIGVNYTVAGTATGGADYGALSGSVEIPAGASSATVTVATATFDDTLFEGLETVVLALTGTNRASVSVDGDADEATATIADDELETVSVTASDAAAAENPADGAVFTVSLSSQNDTGAPVGVNYAVGGSATAGSDYAPLGGSVAIPAGAESATIAIDTSGFDDALFEGTETIVVTLTGTDHAAVAVDDDAGQASAAIEDDDGATATLTASDADAAENPAGGGAFTVTLSRQNDTGAPVAVSYAVAGSATGGADYTTLSGTVTVPTGASSAPIAVVTEGFDDSLLEAAETVQVTLTGSAHGAVAVDATPATVTIADDEQATATLSVDAHGAEAGPVSVVFRVTLSRQNDTGAPITFALDPVGGSAAAGADYADFAGATIAVPPGASSATFVVAVLGDALLEASETIEARISSPSLGAVTFADDTATASIADDETATVGITASDPTAAEPPGDDAVFTVTLSRTNNTGAPIAVAYTVNGTAGPDVDYAALAGTVLVPAGASSATITVSTAGHDDDLPEGSETVQVTLTGTDNPAVGASGSATVTITDDDTAGVSVAETSDSTAVGENGTTDELRVRLTAKPVANVVVTLSMGLGQATVGGPLTFTPADWNVEQYVAVTAVDDHVIEGPHADAVDFSTSSSDPAFDALAGADVVTVSIADDDVAGVAVVVFDDVTSEDGDTASFGIRLTARPSAPVTIALSSSNTGEATVPASITIQPDDWSDPSANVVTITGVDDSPPVGDGAVAVTILTGDVTSDDSAFNALTGAQVDNVTVYNQNNDPPGIVLEVLDSLSGEDGSTAAVRFRLLSQPADGASVTIPLSIADGSEASVPASVTIAADDWDDPAANEVLVTGINDPLDDGDVLYQLVTGDPTSVDAGYEGLDAADVVDPSLTNVDDDEPALLLTESDGSTSVTEGGAADTLALALATRPAPGKQVVVRLVPHPQLDLGAGPGTPVDVVFTDANWAGPVVVTVTATDDGRLEGDQSASISYLVDAGATTEDGYDGITLGPTAVSITDDEEATLSVVAVADAVEQPAAAGTFEIVLSHQNDTGAPITIAYSVAGTAVAGTDYTPPSGTATIANGQSSVLVSVAPIDDELLESDETVVVSLDGASHPQVSVDGAAGAATLAIADDEQATASLALETDGAEAGPVDAVFRVTLSRSNDTGAPITFTFAPSGGTATANADYTDFTGATISVPAGGSSATFTVDVLDDTLLEAAETLTATLSSPSLARVTIDPAAATATIEDDDVATVSIAAPDAVAAEAPADGATFTVTLSRQNDTGSPVEVTYTFAGSATGGADYAGLSGTAAIPAGGTSVTIAVATTGFDDALAEGLETVTVTLTGTSNPAVSVNTAADDATVTIADDDVAGVVVAESGGSTAVAEGGSGDWLRVRLTAQPLEDVVVTLTADLGQVAALGAITFTPGDWNVEQLVPVTAVDDAIVEGAHTDRIDFSTSSADPGFDGLTGNDVVTVSVADNDVAGAIVTVLDDLTSEDGDTARFAVRLTSRPFAPVTIALASSNTGEATVPASITIQPDDWNDPSANVVTVTGVEDSPPVGDGAVAVTIVTGEVTSGDPAYEALTGSEVDDVTVYNQNNDPPGIMLEVVDAESGEDPSTAVVRFRLLSLPVSDVTIPLSISDSSEADLGGVTSVTISPANWDQPQNNEVVVTGVDDSLDDGDVLYRLITGDPTSGDLGYDALTAVDVADPGLTNVDDEAPAVVVDEPGDSTQVAEGGATDTIELRLTSRPAPGKQVVVTVLPHPQLDAGAGPGEPVQVVFTEANWSTPHAVTIRATNDARLEGDHAAHVSYLVDANLTTEDGYDGVTYAPTSVSIDDDDTATVAVAAVADAFENPALSGRFEISLSRQNDTGAPITVTYAIGGTAAPGSDYAPLLGTAVIPNGRSSASVVVDTLFYDDALLEGAETVVLTLDGASYPAVSVHPTASQATITIVDSEQPQPPPVAALAHLFVDLSVASGGSEAGPTPIVYAVTLSAPNHTGAPIVVRVDPGGGTASAGSDYGDFAGAAVAIPPGATGATLSVIVVDDALLEGTQSVEAKIVSVSTTAVSVGVATALASIADDERATATIRCDRTSFSERFGGVARCTIVLTQPNQSGAQMAIRYTVGGTAVGGEDFVPLAGTVTIPDGATTGTVLVDLRGFDDDTAEGRETVLLTLEGNGVVGPGQPGRVVLEIEDDEGGGPSFRLAADGLLVLGRTGDDVACRLTAAALRGCSITVRTLRGALVARGTRTLGGPGRSRVPVVALRTAFGQGLLERTLGGVPVVVVARGRTVTGAIVTTRTRTWAILDVERTVTFAGSWMPDRAVLTGRGRQYVKFLRGKLRLISSVTCEGHTARVTADSRLAIPLSRQRAEVMCDYLRELGVRAPMRIVARGNSRPVASNATEPGRRQNRRVVVTIKH